MKLEPLYLSKLVLPFFATIGAALTVMYINSINRRVEESKQKIYAASYILDSSSRMLEGELIVLVHTIVPHIEASYRIGKGDEELLETMLLTDEFDILTEAGPKYSHVPNEFTLQLGYDQLELVQIYDSLCHIFESDSSRVSLNNFVKENLKSMDSFMSKSNREKTDILNSYIDHLYRLQHESNRLIFMISYIVLPKFSEYTSKWNFWFYKTKNATNSISKIERILEQYSDYIPEHDYLEQVRHGGIQKEVG